MTGLVYHELEAGRYKWCNDGLEIFSFFIHLLLFEYANKHIAVLGLQIAFI